MGGGEVRLVGLVKRFEDVTAVDGIDLEVRGGELFSLLGPSGCGKTTTLRLIAGFEQPTAGAILLDGVDMARTPPHKRKVNTVFQSYALFPHLSVEDNVAFGLRRKRVPKDEVRRRVAAELERGELVCLDYDAPELRTCVALVRLRDEVTEPDPARARHYDELYDVYASLYPATRAAMARLADAAT